MQKRVVYILLLMFVLVMVLNVVLLVKYTGNATGSSQGVISLTIESRSFCGNSSCDSGESCSSCPADCGSCPVVVPSSSGGGAGGGKTIERDFFVEDTIIKVLLRQGESFKKSIVIKNTDKSTQNFNLIISPSLEGLVFISEASFSLESGKEKSVDLVFVSSEETEPGIYTGNIKIKTPYKTKEVLIIDSIRSKMVLFDISLDIPAKYKELYPGKELLLQLTLFNLGEVGKTDVDIEYFVKDFEGNVLLKESEVVAVETQVSFSKLFKLPSDIKPGDYVVAVQARYDSSVGSSSSMFHIKGAEGEFPTTLQRYFLIAALILVLFIVLMFLLRRERRKIEKVVKSERKKIEKVYSKPGARRKVMIRENNKISKISGNLNQKLIALENAFRAGYIKKDSYKKGKERISKMQKK